MLERGAVFKLFGFGQKALMRVCERSIGISGGIAQYAYALVERVGCGGFRRFGRRRRVGLTDLWLGQRLFGQCRRWHLGMNITGNNRILRDKF